MNSRVVLSLLVSSTVLVSCSHEQNALQPEVSIAGLATGPRRLPVKGNLTQGPHTITVSATGFSAVAVDATRDSTGNWWAGGFRWGRIVVIAVDTASARLYGLDSTQFGKVLRQQAAQLRQYFTEDKASLERDVFFVFVGTPFDAAWHELGAMKALSRLDD